MPVRYFCDWCGEELKTSKAVGVRSQNEYEPEKTWDMVCMECLEAWSEWIDARGKGV